MGEHRRPVLAGKKKKWDAMRGDDGKRHRYAWRSQTDGTFKYGKGTFGALTRRQWKTARKLAKKWFAGDSASRTRLMADVMGVDL